MSILNLILLLLLLLHLAAAGRPGGNVTRAQQKKKEEAEEEDAPIKVNEREGIWVLKEKMTTLDNKKTWNIKSDFPVTSLNIVDEDSTLQNQPIKGNDVVIIVNSNCPRYEIPPVSIQYDDQTLSVTWKRPPNNKTQSRYDHVDYDTFLEPSSFEATWAHQGVAGYQGICMKKSYMGLVNMKGSNSDESDNDILMGAPSKEGNDNPPPPPPEEDHFMGAPMKDTPPQQEEEEPEIPFGAPAKEEDNTPPPPPPPQAEIPYGAPAKEGNAAEQRRSNLRPSSSSSSSEEEEEEQQAPPPAAPQTPSTTNTRMEQVPRKTWTSNRVVMTRSESSEEEDLLMAAPTKEQAPPPQEEEWTSDVVRMTRNNGQRRRLGEVRQLRQQVGPAKGGGKKHEEEDDVAAAASTEEKEEDTDSSPNARRRPSATDASSTEEEEETADDAEDEAEDDPPARYRSRGGTWGGGESSSSDSRSAGPNTGFITSREPVRTSTGLNGAAPGRQQSDESEEESNQGTGRGSVYKPWEDRNNMTACVVNVEILHSGCLDEVKETGTAEGRTWAPRIIKAPIVREISVRELPPENMMSSSEPDESCAYNYTANLTFPEDNELVYFTGNETDSNSTSVEEEEEDSISIEDIEERGRMLKLVDLPQASCSNLLP